LASVDALHGVRLGERWVVRVRLADGSATDRIGWVDAVDADGLRLGLTDGSSVSVGRSTVVAARRAPAAIGGPPPHRVDAVELERRALFGWLADHEPLGAWTLRAGGGFTGRANSAHAVGDPGLPLAEAAAEVIAYAARHGIAPMAQVITGSAEDAGLRSLGWTDTYVPTDVLALRLVELLGDHPIDPQVSVTETLSTGWWDAYQLSRPNAADPGILRAILDGNPPRGFGAVGDPDQPVAIGRAHLSGDWLGLASIWTADEHRRRGWATKIMIGLGHWAARRGARYVYLQVASANTPALAAYARLGFTHHHSYLYLAPPGST